MSYSDERVAGLPWGYWLKVGHGGGISDEDGRRFGSVRDALWQGRLDFVQSPPASEQELLLAVLAARDRRQLFRCEPVHELFAGNHSFRFFFMNWLRSVGLFDENPSTWSSEGDLSEEGRAVLLMLMATRDAPHHVLPVGDPSLLGTRGRRGRPDAFASFERDAARLPHVFERVAVAGMPAVTLTSRLAGGRMPISRVLWSQTFAGEDVRDGFFAWLAQRVDRWETWGEHAFTRGAPALTAHLLESFVCSVADIVEETPGTGSGPSTGKDGDDPEDAAAGAIGSLLLLNRTSDNG